MIANFEGRLVNASSNSSIGELTKAQNIWHKTSGSSFLHNRTPVIPFCKEHMVPIPQGFQDTKQERLCE
jgi:hypothetical protein